MNEERKIEIEEVEEASKPARARVETYKRKRDYLEGFLAEKSDEPEPAEPGGSRPPVRPPDEPGSGLDLYEQVIEALKEIYDPEIPVNIYELGLIYNVEVSDDGDAKIVMTLTTPHCPVAESMPGEVELRVCAVPGIRTADVELVWDPPWDPQKMSDEAKLELGML